MKKNKSKFTPMELRYYGKVQSEYDRKCREIPTLKESVTFKQYLKKRALELYEDECKDLERRQKSFEAAQRLSGIKTPTFWDKLEDPVYNSSLKARGGENGTSGSSLSKQWGIGKPKYPN